MPEYKYAIHNGKDPYGFSANGLVGYFPLWAIKNNVSFQSVDANKSACTKTIAPWSPPGIVFDGADSKITITTNTGIQNIFDGGGTILAWVNPHSDGENDAGRIIHKLNWNFYVGNEAAGIMKLNFGISWDTTPGTWITTATVLPINTNSFIGLTYNADNVANDPIFYFNSAVQANTETGIPEGTRPDDSANDMNIGNYTNIRSWDGLIGELWIYSRILSIEEIQNVQDCTSWRY